MKNETIQIDDFTKGNIRDGYFVAILPSGAVGAASQSSYKALKAASGGEDEAEAILNREARITEARWDSELQCNVSCGLDEDGVTLYTILKG